MVDFLAVRGLKTSGGKAELVACALLAVEFKLPNIEWSEEQQKDYDAERLKKYSIWKPLSVEEAR